VRPYLVPRLQVRPDRPPAQFEAASRECIQMRDQLRRERSDIAFGRLGAYLPPQCLLAQLFACPSVSARLSAVTGQALTLSDYPLELRHYGPGSGMAWHKDEQLFVGARPPFVDADAGVRALSRPQCRRWSWF